MLRIVLWLRRGATGLGGHGRHNAHRIVPLYRWNTLTVTVTCANPRSNDPNARAEGFYWMVLGQNPPEIAYWERGEWWLAGDARPWQPDAANVLSDKLVFRPRLTPVAGCDVWHPRRSR